MSRSFYLKCLVLLDLLPCIVFGFDFSFTAPTSCDNLSISWSGGRGPFSLLITPFFNVPQNISIPDSAVYSSSGNGSSSFQLKLPPGRQFLLTMSDSTGFGSGGTSDVLTVGSPVNGAKCDTTEPRADFFFELNSALQQCRMFTFSGYDNATQPGLIPLGQSFELDPSKGPASFDWIANVPSGTSIVFIMTDSDGRQGGSSDLKAVGASDDDRCINASSPRSTAQAIATGPVAPTATETARLQSGSKSKTGTIAGATIGALAFIAITGLGSFLCFRRQKRGKLYDANMNSTPVTFVGSRPSRISRMRNSIIPSNGRTRRAHSSFDLLPPTALNRSSRQSSPLNQSVSEAYAMPNPYIIPSEPGAVDGHSTFSAYDSYPRAPSPSVYRPRGAGAPIPQSHTQSYSLSDTDQPFRPTSFLSNPYPQGHARRPSDPYSTYSVAGVRSSGKASQVGVARSMHRLVLHTDAEDVVNSDDGDEVIELPPRYTDRRDPSVKVDQTKSAD